MIRLNLNLHFYKMHRFRSEKHAFHLEMHTFAHFQVEMHTFHLKCMHFICISREMRKSVSIFGIVEESSQETI